MIIGCNLPSIDLPSPPAPSPAERGEGELAGRLERPSPAAVGEGLGVRGLKSYPCIVINLSPIREMRAGSERISNR